MNLISKRTGIGDHFRADKFTNIMFKNASVYMDTVNNDGDVKKCIKNQYVSDEWLVEWIKCNANKTLGKDNAFYVYNVDYDGIHKPNLKSTDDPLLGDDHLYNYSNGVMYFDFDNIGKENVELIRDCFNIISKKHHAFQWFETSWSGEGCHIRTQFELKFKKKTEWMFLYMHFLNIIMLEVSKHIDTSEWYDNNTIDWSCASITRGFAIPYNENGVTYNENFDKTNNMYDSADDFNMVGNYLMQIWNSNILEKFHKKIGKKKQCKSKLLKSYAVTGIDTSKAHMYDGEMFDYNWRLKCVTTLMGIYDGDKDKVRTACKYIYSCIQPYKQHTYNEMIHDELEYKIFRNGNMQFGIFHSIIKDLREYFGFEFKDNYKANNNIYLSEFHKNIFS